MIGVDRGSTSAVVGTGVLGASWSHPAAGDARAAALFVVHAATAAPAITAVTYGGEVMEFVAAFALGAAARPGVQLFFLDDVPGDEQPVAFSKASIGSAFGHVVTLLADGAVVVGDCDGGAGLAPHPHVPELFGPPSLGLAAVMRINGSEPVARSHDPVSVKRRPTFWNEIQHGHTTDDIVFDWRFEAASSDAAWLGALFADPDPSAPLQAVAGFRTRPTDDIEFTGEFV